ncbi:MAG: YifB family Mg chelatase-like AAA ATPase [Firmicutes bacterium]|nr:YifB family Mg chelatase-like AAA ATPase [Bacillota bacterium]
MFAKVHSAAVIGIDAFPLEIEVDVSGGNPNFIIVGLPDTSVSESKERVRTALINSKLTFPFRKIVVNMAPADIRKEGASFDLPIALGILAATEQISSEKLETFLIIGELALDGALRRTNGVLPVAAMLKESGIKKVIVPKENANEASLVEGIDVYPAGTLSEAVNIVRAEELFEPYRGNGEAGYSPVYQVDFSDVKGQEGAKRALEVAAAGGHNLIMIGPPGSGKTMLAKRVPTILPPMSREEALEVTRIFSISGLLSPEKALIMERSFRSPHHSASKAGLVGGGAVPRPGEVSLAHRGVLFLDEIPEFDRNVLEVLRQPMEDGIVTISRATLSLTFPAQFMLIASMNPCPCGFATDPSKECTCPQIAVRKYLMKISGPLMDRIDIHIEVPRLKFDELTRYRPGEPSEDIRKRVIEARGIQKKRFENMKVYANADMLPKHIKKYCILPTDAKGLLKQANEQMGLSARAYDRILKLSRTIADLAGSEKIATEHVAEAIQYRSLDRAGMMG